MLKIQHLDRDGIKAEKVSLLNYKSTPMKRVLDHLFVEVDKAYRDGTTILLLSDRGVDENHVAIPSLLAVSAVHKHLVETKKCTAMSLILESGELREVHHFATLLGYGASSVHPYLAHSTIQELIDDGLLDKDYYAAVEDYDSAVLSGIVKIASKMGISTIQSYQGSKIFEAIGISENVINEYFPGTVSRVGGIILEDIAAKQDAQHSRAFDPLGRPVNLELEAVGRHKFRSQGENHRYNPQTIHMLQMATREGDYDKFKQYTRMVDNEKTGYLRSLMDFNF
jgi:glutamate synthase (ferredoxin)